MDTSLSDLLTCPRCGPTYGLILLPHEVADRRVREGVLGCANCRERYPVAGGVADLRLEGKGGEAERGADPGASSGGAAVAGWSGESLERREAAIRLAALMGLTEAQGVVVVAGPGAAHAGALAALLEEIEVIAVGDGGGGGGGGRGVSRLRVDAGFPLRTGSMRGVTLTGARSELLEEGARLLERGARLVLDPAPGGAGERLAEAGLEVVAQEGGVVVAVRHA